MSDPGTQVGPYRLVRLGPGAFGEVWVAQREPLTDARPVALKLLRRLPADPSALKREAQRRADPDNTQRPNLVPWLEADVFDGRAAVACPLREGSLKTWLVRHQGRAPSVEAAVALAGGVLKGLEQLHGRGGLHRDLKPTNVLLHRGEPQLSDFGLAGLFDAAEPPPLESHLLYQSPESLRGRHDVGGDLWAAGVIVYRLLTGRSPFPDRKAIQDPSRPLEPPPRDLPGWLRSVLERALAKDPADRFPTARAFRDALEARGRPAEGPAPAEAGPAAAEALERYRRAVLALCESIGLTAPTTEGAAAGPAPSSLLELLYVPLRVRVEAAAGAEAASGAEGADLEVRRLLGRLRAAGRPIDDAAAAAGPEVYVGERLKAAGRLVVLGDPGSGKTTLVKWLAAAYLLRLKDNPDFRDRPDVRALPDKDWLPIVVRCRDLDPANLRGLDDMLAHLLGVAEMERPLLGALQAVLHQRLANDGALLLIDGLDEIADLTLRRRFWTRLRVILRRVPDAPVILTSRVVGYREMGWPAAGGFEHVTVAELSRPDKDDFARRWCAVTERPERRATAAEELIAAIHSSERIERLTGNPMLLTTLALVKRRFNRLPRNRSTLYAEATALLLNWRGEADRPLEIPEALPQAQYLAYAMCARGVQQLREDEILSLLENLRAEYPGLRRVKKRPPAEFLALLAQRTGLLTPVGEALLHQGRRVPLYEFRHLTLQEYLAGLALAQECYPDRDPSRSLAEQVRRLAGQAQPPDHAAGGREGAASENWREALRLCVASCRHEAVDDVLRALATPEEGEEPAVARSRAVLAALCLADEPAASDEAAREVLAGFVGQVGPEDGLGPEPRSGVDLAVRELARSEFWEPLRQLLVEAFRGRRRASGSGPACCARLGARANFPQDPGALGGWWGERLEELGRDDAQGTGAALAVLGVGPTRPIPLPPGLVEALLGLLGRPGPPAHAAAWALWRLQGGGGGRAAWSPDPPALRRLCALIADTEADRRAAAYAAQVVGRQRFAPAVPALIGRLKDGDRELNRAVGAVLVAFGKQAVGPLIDRVRDESQDQQVRLWAMAVLERLDPGATDFEWEGLFHHPPPLRSRALALALRRPGVDDLDRKLMTKHFDGQHPYRDPRDAITGKDMARAVEALRLPLVDVQRRYQRLARRLRLRIEGGY